VNTIVLLFWLWIPWQAGGPTFHETRLEFKNYTECMGMREHLITVAQIRYPAGTVADGWCSPKGAFHDIPGGDS